MKQSFTPIRLFVEVLLVVALAETLVMLALPILAPGLTGLAEGLVDVALLTLVSAPTVYWRCMSATRLPAAALNEGKKDTDSRFSFSLRAAVGMVAAAQLIGLAATVGMVFWLKNNLDSDAQALFDRGAERIQAEVKRRFSQPMYGLKGARGTYAASRSVTRQDFRAYVESRDLAVEFPGIRGFGFIARVPRGDLAAFVAVQRADVAPEFEVQTQGTAPDLFVVKFIEPIADNRASLGFDIGQELVRREAAERAMNTGQPALTGKIILVQDGKKSPGMLYFLPVYRSGADPVTAQQHRAALVGLLYTPMVADELFWGLAGVADGALRLELFDGAVNQPDRLLYESESGTPALATADTLSRRALPAIERVYPVNVGGRILNLRLSSTALFDASQDRSILALAGVAGALASMLIALTIWLLAVGRLRAQRQAQRMTADLDRLARVVQHTNNAVTIADTQMRITWINEGFTRLTGYTQDDARGRTPADLLGTANADPQTIQILMNALAKGEPCRVEVLNRAKDGHEYWVDTEVQPTRDATGALIGFMEIGADITLQKQTQKKLEAALRASSAMLSTVEMHTIVSIADRQGVIIEVNEAFCDRAGYSREELIGQDHRIVNSGVHPEQFWTDMWGQISTGASWRGDICNRGKDGTLYWVDSMIAPFIGDDGLVEKYVSMRTDITVRKQADEQLKVLVTRAEQASSAKSQFVANMSHEIRTPMNAILGMLKLLENTDLTAGQLDYVEKTEGAARSLLGLLNDILDYSKVEAGKMTLDPRPFRVDRLMRDLSVILSANVGAKNIEVLFDVDPTLPKRLVGDDMRLQQVLINLGGNAIKFTSSGEVVLRLRVVEGDAQSVLVEFAMKDSGIGIAPENQAHIFSGFSQAEASTTRRYGGTGLGLAISSRMVNLLGGTLALDSVLGEGSTFHFQIRFPVAEIEALPVTGASPALASGPLHVLIVDDNNVAREVLSHLVEPMGWKVTTAARAEQAIADVQARFAAALPPFDAIFMDFQMPGMDGWEASQRIRELAGGEAAPIVIMVTAHGRELLSGRSAAEQARINGFLVKPVTASMLFDAVMDAKSAAAAAVKGRNPTARQAVVKPKRLLGLRLLVVEDNKINQLVAKGLLGQEGAEVTLADDGQLGVAAVKGATRPFDVVLMDVQMPVMDGYAATRVIREELGLTALPIIAMTANAMASDRAACLAAGMSDHVGKPFDLDHLVAMLIRYAGKAGARQPEPQDLPT